MKCFQTIVTVEKQRMTNGYRWIIYRDSMGLSRIGFPYGEIDDDSEGKIYRAFIVTHTENGKTTNIVYLLNKI